MARYVAFLRGVSFLRVAPRGPVCLPIESDGAQVLQLVGRDVFTAYVPSPKRPVFVKLLEQPFGKDITTRTWETVRKCVAA